ncbi:hypothetical protein HN873_068428 [Arachis hypogaea]
MVILYRQCQLRRLRLVQCYFYNITEEGLCEIAQKLSLLEELDITLCSRVSSVTLEAIGRGCPLLKSFKFNDIVYSFIGGNNDEAFAIAQNMPNLRHLQLVKNRLDNDGVSAILDSCRCLESLDLYWCYNANLEGRLRKMCDKQLKDFIEPNTPDDFRDYKYIERCCYESWYYDFTMDYNSHGKDYYNESQGNGRRRRTLFPSPLGFAAAAIDRVAAGRSRIGRGSRHRTRRHQLQPSLKPGQIHCLRKTNDLLNQEVSKLQKQIQSLKQKSEMKDKFLSPLLFSVICIEHMSHYKSAPQQGQKRGRSHPTGSGKKQQLPSLG